MEEKDLELVCLLGETKNITKAAEQMYITQSALSKRIKTLESELNVELLLRSRQGIHFTPAGEIVLKYANEFMAQLNNMKQELDQLDDDLSGTVKIGVSVNFSIYRLPAILASFHEKYPKVKFKIYTGRSSEIFKKMIKGDFDIAIVRGLHSWESAPFLLAQEPMCLIYAEKYKDVPLTDYLYIEASTDSETMGMIARWMKEHGIDKKPSALHADSLAACTEMVRAGLGWAILPEITLDNFNGIKQPCYFANGEPFLRQTNILSNKETQDLPQVNAFLEELKSHHEKGRSL